MNYQKLIRAIVAIVMMLIGIMPAMAADYCTIGGIKYIITSSEEPYTVGVTYKTLNYNSYSGDVIIPESIEYNGKTYTVTSIQKDAFMECTELTNVTIPNTIVSIGSYAFQWMYLEPLNNQNQPEITKHKPLIINAF